MNLVVLPQLVKGMCEAVVVRWIKGPGEQISFGDPLWEVETEKAIVELESPFSGTVRMVHCQPGDVIPIGFQAAQIGAPQEPVLDLCKTSGSGSRDSSSGIASVVETTVENTSEGVESESVAERSESQEVIIPFPQIQREATQEESVCLQATGTLGSCSSAGILSPAPLSGVRSPHPYLRSTGNHTRYYRDDSPAESCEPYSDRNCAALLNAGSISDRFFASGNIAPGKSATDKYSSGNIAPGKSVSGNSAFTNVAGENPSSTPGASHSVSKPLAAVADLTRCASVVGPCEMPQPAFSDGLDSSPQNALSNAENSSSITDKWLQMDLETLPAVEKTIPLSPLRRTIAQRMTYSAQNIPTSVLFRKADVSELVKMRLKVNRFSKCKISLNDYVTRAIVVALTQTAGINVSFENNQITQYSDINLGFAVDATDGLLVPVIHKAQNMDIVELAQRSKNLIQLANDGKLTLRDYSHPTFSISNTGVFGVEYTVPIIVAPQAGIMGIGAVVDEPVLKDGTWESHKKLGLSYAFDHRVIDGALGAKFLQNTINLLENPLELIWKED